MLARTPGRRNRAYGALTLGILLVACGGTSTNAGKENGNAAGDGFVATAGSTSNGGGSADAGNTSGGAASGGMPNGGSSAHVGRGGGATSGGATNGGATNGGATNGGATNGGATNGGATNGGATNGGATNGGATNGGQGGSAATGSVCAGYVLNAALVATARCSSVADCGNSIGVRCQTTPPTYSCGGVEPIHACNADVDCGSGRVCDIAGCGLSACIDACPTQACASSEDCTAGHCTPKSCDEPGALPCAAGSQCKAVGGTASCQPIACNAGYSCAATWDCQPGLGADPHGCLQRACSSASDCACGFCVSGLCEPTPGYCFQYAPPP
jgi:hypothetical protein